VRSYRRTVVTSADPRQVWQYLADFTTTNEWDPRANHTRRVSGDGGVGSTYETDVSFLGRTTRMTYTVTALEAHRRIEWVGENKAVRAHDVIEIRSAGGGAAVVDYTSSYAYKRAPAVLDRLMALPLNRLCDEAQQGLRTTLSVDAAA
jgi:Polyketide cyclase / dehydrase and lipid transport